MVSLRILLITIALIECSSFARAAERCDNYFNGIINQWGICPNYCCGSYTYRYCCSSCTLAYPSRGCSGPSTSGLSAGAIIGIVIGCIFGILALIAVVFAIVKCCAAQQAAEDAAMVPPPPDVTVITAPGVGASPFQPGPVYQGNQMQPYPGAPYPGPQPPPYGPGYNQQVAPGPNVIVVNQSRPQPAQMMAPPMIAPMPLIMPLPIGGFGHHHHHHDFHYGGGGGGIDAPIATGNYGGGGVDAPIASGFD